MVFVSCHLSSRIAPNDDTLDKTLKGGNSGDGGRLEGSGNDLLAAHVLVRAEDSRAVTLQDSLWHLTTWWTTGSTSGSTEVVFDPLLGHLMYLLSRARPLWAWGKSSRPQITADQPSAPASCSRAWGLWPRSTDWYKRREEKGSTNHVSSLQDCLFSNDSWTHNPRCLFSPLGDKMLYLTWCNGGKYK